MNSAALGIERHARTLRAWHLAVLRYAVTLDNADRLAVLRIVHEIDRFELRRNGSANFDFFRRTSAEVAPRSCSRTNAPLRFCGNTSHGSTTTASDGWLRQRSTSASRRSLRPAVRLDTETACGRGFPPAASIDSMRWSRVARDRIKGSHAAR